MTTEMTPIAPFVFCQARFDWVSLDYCEVFCKLYQGKTNESVLCAYSEKEDEEEC